MRLKFIRVSSTSPPPLPLNYTILGPPHPDHFWIVNRAFRWAYRLQPWHLMSNFHLAGMPSGASCDPEKPTTAHPSSGMQNISATSSSVCTNDNSSCVILTIILQSLLLGVRNGNTLKTDSTWKALRLWNLLRLPVVQKSGNTPQENHRLTMEIPNPHSISRTSSRYLASQAVHSSLLQAQVMDTLVPLKIPHREATTVPPLSAPGSRTLVKATIKAILLLDREVWTSLQANLVR